MPLVGLMVNLAASVPPVIEKVTVSLLPSVAVTVVTAVLFSGTLSVAVVPPALLVITGATLLPLAVIGLRVRSATVTAVSAPAAQSSAAARL